MSKAREEMEANIKRDYPELNPFILRNLLDLYFSEDGKTKLDAIVKEEIKKDRKLKPKEKRPPPTEYITTMEVRKWEDTDFEKRIAESNLFKIISPEIVEVANE